MVIDESFLHAVDPYYWALLEPVSPELSQSVCHYSV